MTTSEYNDMSRRIEKAGKIRQGIIVLEDLIEAAKFSQGIKIFSTAPGPIYQLTEDEQDQFIRWARGKIQELKQQFKEL
jgi:hypothetical protein